MSRQGNIDPEMILYKEKVLTKNEHPLTFSNPGEPRETGASLPHQVIAGLYSVQA